MATGQIDQEKPLPAGLGRADVLANGRLNAASRLKTRLARSVHWGVRGKIVKVRRAALRGGVSRDEKPNWTSRTDNMS